MARDLEPSTIETNLSWVFLTPDRVFKLLKPVHLPFLDNRRADARCASATREFEINQAISPDVYLGLSDVVGEDGQLVDRMIVMRRLDEATSLANERPADELADVLHDVARRVATMHAASPALHGEDAAAGMASHVLRNWEDNLLVIERCAGRIIPEIEIERVAQLARNYIAGRSAVFAARQRDGWIRTGHGDLRCEHVFVDEDGVHLIDALAFDDEYRVADVLNDVAFLAMDLDRLHGPDAAISFMQSWGEFTNEHHPSSLAHFYVAYRAHVRAKVACLAAESGVVGAAEEARDYHSIAVRHLEHAQPRMVFVGGGPGTGKSTVAEGVGRRIGAVWLRADEIRKDLAGIGHDDHAFAAPGEGIYSPEMNARVDTEIARRAELLLANGESVVLDATWARTRARMSMREVAAEWRAEVDELRCVAPNGVCKERIARRMAMVHNPSDASPELVDHVADRFDEWPEARIIDTNTAVAASIDHAVDSILGRPSNTSTTSAPKFFLDVPAVQRLTGIWMFHEGYAPVATG